MSDKLKLEKGYSIVRADIPAIIVATVNGDQSKEFAELMVKATNSFDDMLEALKEIVRISDRKHEAWDRAKAAIKKATITT